MNKNAQWWLVVVLRCMAAAEALAIVPVFMPHEWMDACHRWLGLGDLPRIPVIVYLTRSLSAMYVAHAGLLWLITRDVVRYRPVITYFGWLFIAFGTLMLFVDFHAGLPWSWILGEGPVVVAVGLAVLILQRREERPTMAANRVP